MCRTVRRGCLAVLGVGCAAADPLVETPIEPAWTEAQLRSEVGRVLDLMDPASQQAGGASVAQSLALDEALYPPTDEDGRRLLLEDTLAAADATLGCPTRGLVAGVWVPTSGRTGAVTGGMFDGGAEPAFPLQGSYQDGSDGPGDSLLVWEDAAGGQGELEGAHEEPDPQALAAYSAVWVGGETGDAYGQAAGAWHPFRNQPGGLVLGTWVSCAEPDAPE